MRIGALEHPQAPLQGPEKSLDLLLIGTRLHFESSTTACDGKIVEEQLRRLSRPEERLAHPYRFCRQVRSIPGVVRQSGEEPHKAPHDVEHRFVGLSAREERSRETLEHL